MSIVSCLVAEKSVRRKLVSCCGFVAVFVWKVRFLVLCLLYLMFLVWFQRKLVLFVLWFLLFFWFGIEGTSSACLYLILYLLFVCQESDKNLVVYYLLFGFLVWKRSYIYCLVALKMEEIKANWNFEVLSLQKEEKFNKIWGVLNFGFLFTWAKLLYKLG